MYQAVPFIKYSGCGNDFIVIDNRSKIVGEAPSVSEIKRLCHRQQGIGADGLILLENSHKCDFRMRIFNADGSEAEMCGNGVRCLARFTNDLGYPHKNFTLETMHQEMHVSIIEDLVRVMMPPPVEHQYNIDLRINDKQLTLHHLDTGVPHAVLFVENIEDEQLMRIAPEIRFHSRFAPKGTNVNFAKILSDRTLQVRTYERGVEGETLACGTGATASAVVAAKLYGMPSPISVLTRSGDHLSIDFDHGLHMTGPAVKIFSGILD